MTQPVLFDCDNTMGLPLHEIDDGLTLLYLLGRDDVDILGITTTFGNGSAEEAYAQTVQLLHDWGQGQIPVYKGAATRAQNPTEAAHFLAQRATEAPDEITLLATGPLGNLQAAAQLDPSFFDNLKHIVCMGGYLRHPLRIGWRDLPELNLSADPAASFAVLNARCPVTLMNAHVCLQATFGWRDLRRMGHWDWGLGRTVRRLVRRWLLTFGIYCGVTVFYLWDLLPAIYISHPELFDRRVVPLCSTVADLDIGTLVVGEETKETNACTHVNMPTRILDPERFKEILFDTWNRALSDMTNATEKMNEDG